MPTYDYACPTCGIFEVFQSIKEDALTTCPTCKKRGLTRLMGGGGGVIFKGDGFWETDYNRSSDYKAKAKADGPAAPAADPKADPAAQPKPQPLPKKAETPAAKPASTTPTPPAAP